MTRKLHILITGCSSGIGLATAQALKERGHQVIASCRKESDVARLCEPGLHSIQLDVSDEKSIDEAVKAALSHFQGRIDALINNAGFAQAGALEDMNFQLLRQQFETNVFGLMVLSARLIPVMRAQKQGRIINISSILGHVSLPFRGAYNASKYALEGLTDTLRLELKSSGIKVITIVPGPIESKFRDNVLDVSMKNINIEDSHFAEQYQKMLTGFRDKKANSVFTQGAEAVTKKIIHAIEAKRPKDKYYITLPSYLLMTLKRFLSSKTLDKILLKISKNELS